MSRILTVFRLLTLPVIAAWGGGGGINQFRQRRHSGQASLRLSHDTTRED
jgi:hypothetical protein